MSNAVILNWRNLFKTHHQWFKTTGFVSKFLHQKPNTLLLYYLRFCTSRDLSKQIWCVVDSKKINLSINFWSSIFIKFYYKAFKNRLASNLHLKKLGCFVSTLFSAIYLCSRCKETLCFLEVYPFNPHQSTAVGQLQSLQWLKTPICILE